MSNTELMTVTTRFDAIMARVDAWAEENAGWDCRADAEDEVRFILECPKLSQWSDDEIVDSGISAWQMAE